MLHLRIVANLPGLLQVNLSTGLDLKLFAGVGHLIQVCNKIRTPIILYVCINLDTTLPVFLSRHQSGYNSLSNSIFYKNTLVCINPDTTLYVFLSIYQSTYIPLLNSIFFNNTCINPDTTLSLSVFLSISIDLQLALELYILQ